MRAGLRGVLVAALALAVLAGCGGDGARRFSGDRPTDAGGGGELAYAIAADPGDLDPLHAETVSAQIVARQVFEPLLASLDGPYGEALDRAGLALAFEPSGDFRVWSFQLRSGVQFQDGSPFNGAAVVANVERWLSDPIGQQLLPGLVAADAPRPNLVRLILALPDRRLPQRLADSRLGLASPPVLPDEGEPGAPLQRTARAGSGPFQLFGEGVATVELGRYQGWWGSTFGLGPALDSISFRIVADDRERARLLEDASVRVAAELPRQLAVPLISDPLLSVVGVGSGSAVGFERSVRGITTARPASLSGVWIAVLTEGG